MKKANIFGPQFYLLLFIVALPTYLLHELGHWGMGQLFGFEQEFRLNGVSILSPATSAQRALTDFAGPAVTLLQGFIAFSLVRRRASIPAFAFLYQAAFMRVVASLISLFYLNDEARLSLFLGLPACVIPVLVSGALIWLACLGSKRLGTTWKDQALCYLVASLSAAAIVGLDMALFR
jgi:hypothetical protein